MWLRKYCENSLVSHLQLFDSAVPCWTQSAAGGGCRTTDEGAKPYQLAQLACSDILVILCVPLFGSVLHATLNTTGSISEAERHACPMLLTCTDSVYLIIFPWFLCFYLGWVSYVVFLFVRCVYCFRPCCARCIMLCLTSCLARSALWWMTWLQSTSINPLIRWYVPWHSLWNLGVILPMALQRRVKTGVIGAQSSCPLHYPPAQCHS